MYSSATASSSASGLSGGEGFGDAEGLGEADGFGEGEEEEAGEEPPAVADGEDFGFEGGETDAFAEGVGDGFGSGLTGPVGRRGAAGDRLGVGDGDGDGAALAIVPAMEMATTEKTAERSLMSEWWTGRSAGDASEVRFRARDCSIHLAATLDDALRVAKNFRMSDHRRARRRAFFP